MPDEQTASNGATDSFKGLDFRCIGPHRGGRCVAVAGHPTDPMTFYFGACAGGIWKTTDAGNYWECVSDGFFSTAAVGALAVSESDPNVIFAGMGETCIRGNVSHGDGVYRSTDGGKSWTNVGLRDTRHIAKVRIHPHNPDVAYVAALGHAFGPNRERGIFRSNDGGKTWQQILFRSENAGAIDLSMDPNNPRILYATFWEAQRYPWALSSGGPGSSIYRSTDGGDTWTELTNNPGLPEDVKGKIGIAVSPANADRVWALVEAKDGALFRSDDAGETWQRLSESDDLRYRAWYYMHLHADPQDQDTCWVLNMGCWKSVDGGATFSSVPTPHGDNHDLWIDPRNPLRMIEGNDGGACVSFNGGVSWSTLLNQPTAQFYHVTTDTRFPYRVYGSQQDNSALSVPSVAIEGAISTPDWFIPGGGESGYIAVRPDNPDVIFGGAIGSGFGNGYMTRYDRRVRQERNITVWPEVTTGISLGASGAETLKYRFQWTFPIVISPHDPNVLYVASNQVLRSTDEGASWEEVSPDLTRNDRTKQGPSGGPITKDNTGAEVYCTIFAFVESPHEKGVFWAGSDDGLIHVSRDGGERWNNVTPPGLPEWTLVSIIEVSPHDPATAYVAATRYKLDDTRPYLFKTSDYGQTWQHIANGIPDGDFTRVIREDPSRRGLLYAGTESGIHVSFDDGQNWERLQSNLPVVPIHDLVIKGTDMVVATHGRSFWVLDDLTPLHRIADAGRPSAVHLFPPRSTPRFFTYEAWWVESKADQYVHYTWAGPVGAAFREKPNRDGTARRQYLDAGQNPPMGAIVTYYLPEKPEGEVTLTFLDVDGKEIKSFSTKKPPKKKDEDDEQAETTEPQLAEGMEATAGAAAAMEEAAREEAEGKEPVISKNTGINRFAWNLRYESARRIPDDKSIEYFFPGPMVLPGRYQARLKVGDDTLTESFEVVPDPRGTASAGDLEAQFHLLMRIREKVTEVHEAVLQIRDLKEQASGWEKRLKGREDSQPVVDAAGALKKQLTEIEDVLIQRKAGQAIQHPDGLNAMLAIMPWFCDFVDARPTKQTEDVFEILSKRADEQLQRLRDVISTDLEAFNARIRELGVPAIVVKDAGEKKAERREPASVGDSEGD
jgi:photosystem II stability/assembly factor-like uncharacterized protein